MTQTLQIESVIRNTWIGKPTSEYTEIVVRSGGVTNRLEIATSKSIPVTPYTEFLIRNIPSDLTQKTILDFGTGTGILAIISSLLGAKRVVAIDRNPEAIELAKFNSEMNGATVEFYSDIKLMPDPDSFELILCNPASLPSSYSLESFFSSGLLGNDMIFESLRVAKDRLSSTGEMRLVHTSLTPIHLTQLQLTKKELAHEFIDLCELGFRDHYAPLESHFENLKSTYGIQYLQRSLKKFELLYMVRIFRSF